MCPPTTVYAIPELMDMLCGLLTVADIMSCTACCREWSSYFGPHRFLHVKAMSSVPGARFLAANGPFMRSLSASLIHSVSFVGSCTRLRELTIAFAYEAVGNQEMTNAASLLQANPSLRTLTLEHDQTTARESVSIPLSQPYLASIAACEYLSSISISLRLNCAVLAGFFLHLPTSLLDFRVDMNVTESRHHPDSCESDGIRLERKSVDLKMQRLFLRGRMPCFVKRMFIRLIKKCPDLEQLHVPLLEDRENEFRHYHELAMALNTECPKLHALSSDICGVGAVPVRHLNSLLRDLRGLGTLSFTHDGCTHQERVEQEQQEQQELIPTTLITTTSMTTIEVLELCPLGYLGSDISTILQSCPRLRQLRARGDGTFTHAEEISRLVSPTALAWECLSTLEVFEVSIGNEDNCVPELDSEQEWYFSTAQDVRLFFHLLKSLPQLHHLAITWMLTTGFWGGYKPMHLAVRHLNRGVRRSNLRMTDQDMRWLGLHSE